MINIFRRIRIAVDNYKLRRERKKKGLCPKHGVAYYIHGYYNEKRCPECSDEMYKQHQKDLEEHV